jgi:CBS domain-containing protein
MLHYKAIDILTTEQAKFRNQPLADAVIDYVRGLKIAARCMVTRGIGGCYESGEVTTSRLEVLSYNLPIRISIVLPAAAAPQVLEELGGLVNDGLITLQDLHVVSHKTANTFFPRQLAVRDVMTQQPVSIGAERPLSEAARLLLSSIFTGLPVVDPQGRPVGVVTQGDLINKGGMPLRLGLLAASGQDDRDTVMAELDHRQVQEIMTTPAVTIEEDRPLTEAVDLMLARGLKRLPVVTRGGRLAGMLSRLDIFQTVMREAPDWEAFQSQKIEVRNLRTVEDILRRDTSTVSESTTIDKVIQIIDGNDIQCVAVVDAEGRLIGMIADSDLLRFFKPDPEGLRSLFARLAHPFAQEPPQRLASTTAGEVMRTDVRTAGEKMLLEEAIRLMTEEQLKRLPVVDDKGRFLGMISRDSLLRTGYHHQQQLP